MIELLNRSGKRCRSQRLSMSGTVISSRVQGITALNPKIPSNPHPFISLLFPTKGKKILPRLTRHIAGPRMLTLLTLLVACFDQLDVVALAPALDSLVETPERAEAERQTQAFLGSVMQSILPVVSVAELGLVTGLLSLLLHRSNIVAVVQTRVRRIAGILSMPDTHKFCSLGSHF